MRPASFGRRRFADWDLRFTFKSQPDRSTLGKPENGLRMGKAHSRQRTGLFTLQTHFNATSYLSYNYAKLGLETVLALNSIIPIP